MYVYSYTHTHTQFDTIYISVFSTILSKPLEKLMKYPLN